MSGSNEQEISIKSMAYHGTYILMTCLEEKNKQQKLIGLFTTVNGFP
jgi:hypothetical protein